MLRLTRIEIFLLICIGLLMLAGWDAKATEPEEIYEICSERYNYDRCDILTAMAFQESRFKSNAFNEKEQARGLFQMKCSTARLAGLKYGCDQLFDPVIAVRFAVLWLKIIDDEYSDRELIAAYNASSVQYCKEYNVFDWGICMKGELINETHVIKVMRYLRYFNKYKLPKIMEIEMSPERWREVVGFPGYIVSSHGRIKSFKRYADGRYLKSIARPDGYLAVSLRRDMVTHIRLIHRIVGEAFIENPLNYKIMNHINGVKSFNHVENLEWCTSSYNNKHAFAIGLKKNIGVKGEDNRFNKLKETEVLGIRKMLTTGQSQREIGIIFNISRSAVASIKSGQTWGWLK